MADDYAIAPGEVWLVGAGPGDPDLLTRKAEKLIRGASVVFFDALVGPGILELVPHGVRMVSVGKRSGRHSKDQKTIDTLIVEAALAGERVVRLKGGDPATFVTAHTVKGQVIGLDWQALADPEATLAVYMGKAAAPQIAAGLVAAGLPGDTPVALLENASLPNRRHFRTTLGLLPIAAKTALGDGPAVILIGRALQELPERKVVSPAGFEPATY